MLYQFNNFAIQIATFITGDAGSFKLEKASSYALSMLNNLNKARLMMTGKSEETQRSAISAPNIDDSSKEKIKKNSNELPAAIDDEIFEENNKKAFAELPGIDDEIVEANKKKAIERENRKAFAELPGIDDEIVEANKKKAIERENRKAFAELPGIDDEIVKDNDEKALAKKIEKLLENHQIQMMKKIRSWILYRIKFKKLLYQF